MRSYTLFAILLFGTVACSETATETVTDKRTEVSDNEQEVKVVADKVATLDIDGMVCQMGCGGSIRKELKSTGAIDRVEFDFVEERATNSAKVYYNSEKINEQQMVDLISKINNGQFSVMSRGSVFLNESNTEEDGSNSNGSEDVKVNTYGSDLSMPNLFDLISEYLL